MLYLMTLVAFVTALLLLWKQVVVDELTAENARLTAERDDARAACKGAMAGLLCRCDDDAVSQS